MNQYKISQSNKIKFKRAALRILRELILADSIIDDDELNYFEAFCHAFNRKYTNIIGESDSLLYRFDFEPQDILDSQNLTLADALMSFKELRRDEVKFFGSEDNISKYYADEDVSAKYKIYLTVNFIGALQSLSRCDGKCDITEAKLCIMLNYILRKDDSFAFSFKDSRYRFAKNELIYVHNLNTSNLPQSEIRYISSRLELFDYKYVSIEDSKNALLSKSSVIGSLLSFVYPLIFVAEQGSSEEITKESRIKLVCDSISKVSESDFINDIFKGTRLVQLTKPYILLKIGKSKIGQTNLGNIISNSVDDFICIPLDESIIRFVDELTDDILVIAHDISATCIVSSEEPLVIKGFVKTLLDYAIFRACEEISEIEIDLINCELKLGNIIPTVTVPARELAMYLFIAILSKISNGLNRNPIGNSLQYKSYCKLFTEIVYRTPLNDSELKLETKYITSNVSSILRSNTLINDVSSLVPNKGSEYAKLNENVLNLISVRYKDGNETIKKETLEDFWNSFIKPLAGVKSSDFL